jgi:hypothetical protein
MWSRAANEKRIIWDCKLHEDQRDNNDEHFVREQKKKKKEYSKSVTEHLKLKEKRFVQGVPYFIDKSRKFI